MRDLSGKKRVIGTCITMKNALAEKSSNAGEKGHVLLTAARWPLIRPIAEFGFSLTAKFQSPKRPGY